MVVELASEAERSKDHERGADELIDVFVTCGATPFSFVAANG
jgi:hypothetical protein